MMMAEGEGTRQSALDSACFEKLAGERTSGMYRTRSKCPVAQKEKPDHWVIPIELGSELGSYTVFLVLGSWFMVHD